LPWLFAASVSASEIRFSYENPKLEPHQYVITVDEDGTGHYRSESTPATNGQDIGSESQDRSIHISKAVRTSMFAAAGKTKFFANCEDGGKNIAFQGNKTLQYEGPQGKGSCQYNWSKNPQIQKLTDQFAAIAATLEEGSKLERRYAHGRLSLDTEMEILTQLVQEGRAIELENIAPILQKLATDEAVLQRVQRRAQALLQTVKND
jgi:hypothetical protein